MNVQATVNIVQFPTSSEEPFRAGRRTERIESFTKVLRLAGCIEAQVARRAASMADEMELISNASIHCGTEEFWRRYSTWIEHTLANTPGCHPNLKIT